MGSPSLRRASVLPPGEVWFYVGIPWQEYGKRAACYGNNAREDTRSLANRKHYSVMATSSGMLVECCHSGEEALEWMARREFDLILGDVRMPGRSAARLFCPALSCAT